MPRYFFTLVYPDQREVRDPKGTTLPSDSAAIGAARTIIEDILRGFKTRRTTSDDHRDERSGRRWLSLSEQLSLGVAKETRRRFPPPWTVNETEACFIVTDNTGQKLAYVYFENAPGRRSAASLLTKDEARRIAANIAKLAELLRNRSPSFLNNG